MAKPNSSAVAPEPVKRAALQDNSYAVETHWSLADGVLWFPGLAQVVQASREDSPKLLATTEVGGSGVVVSWVPDCPFDEWTRGLAEHAIQRFVNAVGREQ